MSVRDFVVDKIVGVELRPKRINIEIYQGDTFTFNAVLTDAASNPIDFTGWSVVAQIRKIDNTPGETPTLDVTLQANGVLNVFLSGTETEILQPQSPETPYAYDVQLTDASGNRRTIIGGTINITEDITE